jgi:putative ABC transport system permease protein
MGWQRLALRRLRDDRAATVGLAVLVLVTAFLAAVAPRVLAGLADTSVRAEVASATVTARNIALLQDAGFAAGPDDDPLALVREAGLDHEKTFPAPVRSLIADRRAIVETGRFHVDLPTTDPAFLKLRIQEGVDGLVRYVAGTPPSSAFTTQDDVGPEAADGVPVFEAGISRAAAERFGLKVDDVVPLTGDAGDPLIGRTQQPVYAFVRLTGTYDAVDPDADAWLGDMLPVQPVIRALSAEVQLLDAAVLLDPGSIGALNDYIGNSGRILRYTWRSFLDPDRLTDRALDRTITAFRQLQVEYPSANITASADVALRSGMLPILEAHRARWQAAASLLSVMALGPALVAVGTLALIAVLAARRRRATMAFARSRGAAGSQVVVPVVVEGLLIAVPAAVAATLLAIALVPAGRLAPTGVAVAGVVAVTVGVVLATVARVVRGTGTTTERQERIVAGASPRRLMLEVLLVVAAIAGALLLRERGVSAVQAATEGAGVDPLIALVPALVGIAAGILVVRLYPVPLAAVAWLARRRRGVVAFLAARRAGEGGAASAVLLVLLATATVGAFAATALDHLDRGADIAAWQEVGGPWRLQQASGPLPSGFDPTTVPGATDTAQVFQGLVPIDLSGPQTIVALPEAANLERVLDGTPVEPAFPPAFATPVPGPIPAIVSQSLIESPRGVRLGETFTLSIEGYNVTYRAVEARAAFPGLPLDRHWVVVAREAFRGQAPQARIVPVYALVRAPAGAGEQIRVAVEAGAPSVNVTGQAERADELRAQPVTNAVRALMLVAALVTAAYAALGVAAALALAGVARTQEVAHLRTLGLTGRQTVQLTVAEHGPTTIAAFVLGGLLGVGLFALLRDGLGLAGLVGSPVAVPLALDPRQLLLILLVLTIVVGVGLLLGVALQRRVAPTAALRGRFE